MNNNPNLNVDITTNSKYGHFIWIGSSYYVNIPDMNRITLLSETFISSDFVSGGCMKMALYLNGNSDDTVSVIQKIQNIDQPILKWSVTGNQGDYWKFVNIPLQLASDNFDIFIEAIINKQSFSTNVAIDDVTVSKFNCFPTEVSTTSTQSPCTAQSYVCPSNGQCINPEKVCNFINDCPDASDEVNCGTCDFEKSTCGWRDDNYGVNWVRQTGPSSNPFGPQIDHTLLNAFGSYLLTVRNEESTEFKAVLIGPTLGPMSQYCTLSFWIHMGGTDLNQLKPILDIFVSNAVNFDEDYEYIGEVVGPLGKDWKQYNILLRARPAGYLVDMYAFTMYSSELNEFTDVGMDDVVFKNCGVLNPDPSTTFSCGDGSYVSKDKVCNFIQDCENGLDEAVCGDCDFEKNTCAWFDDSPGDLVWERGQAGLVSANGPPVDHTLGNPNGWYMYVAAIKGELFDFADLVIDKNIGPSSPSCEFEFYYHMLGQTDDLSVFIVTDYLNLPQYTRILDYIGDAGNNWNRALVVLGSISKPFRVMISAERFWNEALNDIAIDDVKLINCQFPAERPEGCPANYFTCERKACVYTSDICDLTNDCGDNSDEKDCDGYTTCDFESDGFCIWRHVNEIGQNNAEWIISSFINIFGPPRDHSTGLSNGRYVILKGSKSKALLISPIFKPTNLCEFRLFVYIWARTDVGQLNIYSRTATNGGDRLLLSLKTRIGEFWQKQVIKISETVSFQVVIEGISAEDPYQFIVLDDTSFDRGCVIDGTEVTLPTATSTTTTITQNTCNETSFACSSGGQCISSAKVCDFINDCADGSDEKECGTCDFETSTCGWYDDGWNAKWVRKTGPSSNPFGPQVDHTLQTSLGSYLYADRNNYESNLVGVLVGPTLGQMSEFCTLSFWIHMGETDVAFLSAQMDIFISNATNSEEDHSFLGRIQGPLGKDWKQFKFSIGRKSAGYLFDIYVYLMYANLDVSYDEYTDVGIDDVIFENCAANTISLPQNQSLDCNFENDFCNYYFDTTGEFFWKRTTSITTTANTGPGFDRNLKILKKNN